MALTDESIQELQVEVLNIIKEEKNGNEFSLDESGKKYKLINEVNETTQAIAVAPLDKEGKPDYSQTTIVVAGTQAPGGDINNHVLESGFNAVMARNQLTEQTKDVREFYNQSLSKAKKMAGTGQEVNISNMSGFSQAGPAVAKVAAEMKVQKITNFMDWGAWNSLTKNTADYRGISDEELAYINKHLHSYSDQGKDLTSWDGHGGIIPYGKVFTVEGKHHNAGLPKIKGNSLDINWYVKNSLFCSGMTEKQVREIAKRKAKAAEKFDLSKLETWFDSTDPEVYVKEYLEKYGPFEPEPVDKVKLNNKTIMELHKKMGSVSGSKLISLREELVATVADNARLQGSLYQSEVDQKLAQAKESAENHISEVHEAAYQMAKSLSSSEVETLLSEFTLETCWDAGLETGTLEQSASYARKLSEIAEVLEAASGKIVALDKEQAALFGLSK